MLQLQLAAPGTVETRTISAQEAGIRCIGECHAPLKKGEKVAVVRQGGQMGFRHYVCPPPPLYAYAND
jgi:hypothetical protein